MPQRSHAWLWLVAACLLLTDVVLLTLNLWGLRLFGTVVDYQRFGTWSAALSGLGSMIAVVIALSSFAWQRAKSRREVRDSIHREQTSIYVWLASQRLVNDSGHFIGRNWDVVIRNGTQAPVYRWRVRFSGASAAVSHLDKRPLLPGDNVFNVAALDNLEVAQIGEPVLDFLAQDGLVWRRTGTGSLEVPADSQLPALPFVTFSASAHS